MQFIKEKQNLSYFSICAMMIFWLDERTMHEDMNMWVFISRLSDSKENIVSKLLHQTFISEFHWFG